MQIGPYALKNKYALAPMAGLTDVPFRTIAWEMGAGYMVSEMVSGKAELWETGTSRLRRVPVPGVQPVAVQIAGTDPATMAQAAQRHVDEGVQVIDINFGCPAKKVCQKLAGSALLADLPRLGQIVEAVVAAVPVPVTIKTRTGLTPDDEAGLEGARIAALSGAQMITLHGRSRACRFKGTVNHAPARKLKESVDVPVLVNGDLTDARSVAAALSASNADGVMIGRAAIGRPWLFAQLNGVALPSDAQRWEIVLRHVGLMHEFYGEKMGVRIARKHIEAYLVELGFVAQFGVVAKAINKFDDANNQLKWLLEASQMMQQATAA